MSPGSVYEENPVLMDDGNKKPAEVNPRLSTESEGAFGGQRVNAGLDFVCNRRSYSALGHGALGALERRVATIQIDILSRAVVSGPEYLGVRLEAESTQLVLTLPMRVSLSTAESANKVFEIDLWMKWGCGTFGISQVAVQNEATVHSAAGSPPLGSGRLSWSFRSDSGDAAALASAARPSTALFKIRRSHSGQQIAAISRQNSKNQLILKNELPRGIISAQVASRWWSS